MTWKREPVPAGNDDPTREAPDLPEPATAPIAAPADAVEPSEGGNGAVADRAALLDRKRLADRRAGVSPLERSLLGDAGREAGRELADLRRELEGLRQLLKISRELSSILDPDRLLDAVLDSAIQLTQAQRGLLLVLEGTQLRMIQGRGCRQDSLDPESTRISETVARRCLEENRVIPYENIPDLPEVREARSIKALEIYAAVCVPLRDRGTATGVLYLDSSVPLPRATPEAVPLLEAFASQASVALVNARRHHSLEESRLLLARENENLRAEVRGGSGFAQMIGRSRQMEEIYDKIRRIKDTDIAVLVQGESGTGKELVARALHYEGVRSHGPFVAVNCAAFPAELLESTMFGYKKGAFTGAAQDTPGLVEAADGGTLFLDEIGDMPLTLQPKLLRFLELGEFFRVGETTPRRADVRVVSASNCDLAARVRERTFREDLFYRLAVVRIGVPALRDRREDLPLLIEHFVAGASRRTHREVAGITDRARLLLLRYGWPGNVRELRNVIEGAAGLASAGELIDEPLIRVQLPDLDVPEPGPPPDTTLRESSARFERDRLELALARHGWNISRASKELGISRQHLHNRIRRHGLERPQ